MELPRPSVFRLKRKSIVRAIALSLGSFALSLRLAGFPHIEDLHGSRWQLLALVTAVWGMVETGRCMGRRWSLYHAGILLLLYTDLMILTMIVFLLAYS